MLIARQVGVRKVAGGQFGRRNKDFKQAGVGVEPDQVAVADLAIAPPSSASGVTWIAAGTLPEAPDMRPSVTSATLTPTVLQHAEHGGQLVQFRHADGLRPLEAHDGDEVAVELAGLERVLQPLLAVEDHAPAPR